MNKLVSSILPGVLLGLTILPGCTTLENRRDMYSPQRVDGPYTRMLRERRQDVEVQGAQSTITATGTFKNVIE